MKIREVAFEEWVEEYSPSENPVNKSASFGGLLFQTSGEEFSHIVAAHPKRIWTYHADHSGHKIIVQGFLPQEALGYMLCGKHKEEKDVVIVRDASAHE